MQFFTIADGGTFHNYLVPFRMIVYSNATALLQTVHFNCERETHRRFAILTDHSLYWTWTKPGQLLTKEMGEIIETSYETLLSGFRLARYLSEKNIFLTKVTARFIVIFIP